MNGIIPFLSFLIKNWKFLLLNFLICCVFAGVYAFCIATKQYMSSTTFIPTKTSTGMLSLAQLGLPEITSGSDVSPDQISIIFGSVTLRKAIIEKFDYYRKYKLEKSPNPLKLALKRLDKDLEIQTVEKGSLGVTEILSFTINCFHTSPDTAFMIADFTYRYIDSVINVISTAKANETKMFINSQLTDAKTRLDSIQVAFNTFQKENKAYEIPQQLRLTMDAYGELKSRYLANEIKIKSLSREMQYGSAEIVLLKKENAILLDKLNSLESNKTSDVLIGFENYSDLLPKFTNLYRDLETQTKLVAFLTQQYEEARIKETKDISNLILIDKPFVPQYKERPKRAFLLIGIILVYYSILLSILTMFFFTKTNLLKSQFYNDLITNLSKK